MREAKKGQIRNDCEEETEPRSWGNEAARITDLSSVEKF